jgi:hypothetical protein
LFFADRKKEYVCGCRTRKKEGVAYDNRGLRRRELFC